MAQTYPTFAYHATLAPDGRVFQTEEDLTEADQKSDGGWVDSPAKLSPDYVPLPPLAEGDNDLPIEARMAGFVKVHYPSHRYNAQGQMAEVKNAEDEENYDPRRWKDTPDPAAFVDAPSVQAEASITIDPPILTPASVPPAPVAAGPSLTPEQIAEFRAATVSTIVQRLEMVVDPNALDALEEAEAGNPNGARAGVLKALLSRRKLLAAG